MTDYYTSLPQKRMGSGCLLFNESDHVLLVKPNYKDGWEIPGGVVEDNESPKGGCIREVKEELGIDVSTLELLVIDYNTYPDAQVKAESLMFIFTGGLILEDDIVPDTNDHETFAFVNQNLLENYLAGDLLERVKLALHQLTIGKAAYSENQKV